MAYLLLFAEGVLTFISPCLLPMLPVYFTFLAGQRQGKLMGNALLFTAGFSAVFTALGALSGTLGGLLVRYRRPTELVCGLLVVLLGLSYAGVLRLNILQREWRPMLDRASGVSPLLFGIAFALGWTPCIGPMLASALMTAATAGSSMGGMVMLFFYALGIATPFLLAALLFEQLGSALGFLTRHGESIKRLSGGLMVVFGLLMMSGQLSRLLSF
jgi:cytochrome c-type biogenesis protein